MMAKPWASAIATIPGRPTPSPTTAAAPAPMNTNEKVPMNSARSLGAIRLDIVLSRDEIDRSARAVHAQRYSCFATSSVDRIALRKTGVKSKYASASQTTLVRLLRLHWFCDNLRKPEVIQLQLPNASAQALALPTHPGGTRREHPRARRRGRGLA